MENKPVSETQAAFAPLRPDASEEEQKAFFERVRENAAARRNPFAKPSAKVASAGTPEPANNVVQMPLPPGTPKPAKPAKPEKPDPFPLTFFDACKNLPRKNWLIKGVIAEGEESSWYGAPGATKSMLLTDIAVHLASGQEWRGHKTKKKCGVIYFAMERATLTQRRLAAYTVRDRSEKLPIAVCDRIFNILDPESVDAIVATVRNAEAKFGCPVGLLIFDTWAKLVGAAGGDEDRAQWVNAIAVAMRRLQEALGSAVHIAGIGHSGKDAERGERGSNARLGHVDMAVCVAGDAVKTATIAKGNDVAENDLTSYRVEEIPLGLDADGDPVTAGIISRVIVSAEPKTKHRVNEKQHLALNLLDRLIVDQGKIPRIESGLPPVNMVKADVWRDAIYAAGILNRDAANPRTDFSRLRASLATQVAERDGYVWPLRTTMDLPAFPRGGA
jgi:hypothetical protein